MPGRDSSLKPVVIPKDQFADFVAKLQQEKPVVSIVVPVYNEEEVLPELYRRTNQAMEQADSTPIQIAQRSRAIQFLMKMQQLGHCD